jgi:hypothetical protein
MNKWAATVRTSKARVEKLLQAAEDRRAVNSIPIKVISLKKRTINLP